MQNNRVEEFAKNPKKALFTLAWPIIVGMLVQTLYNVVDTAFVGRLGATAIAALTFSFPVFFIIIALNAGVGAAVTSLIARLVGANKKKQAENAAIHAFYFSITTSVLFTVLGLILLRPLLMLFGASGEVLELGISYMRIIFFGSVLIILGWTISSVFIGQGDTKTPTRIRIIALIINIILDPIFIFVLGYGVAGAAIATVIAFSISFLLGLYYMFVKQTVFIKIRPSCFKFSKPILADFVKVGFPAALTHLSLSLYIIIINRFMAHFGTDYVAAFGLGSRLESVAVMPVIGFGFSMLTLVGMFMGAKRYDLLRTVVSFGLRTSVAFISLLGLIFFLIPRVFFRIFTPEPVLLELASAYMRIDVFTFPLMAIGMGVARIIQGMGDGLPGLIINATRIIFVFVPLAYVFVFVIGYNYLSVAVAMVISGTVSSIIGLIWLRCRLRRVVDNEKCFPKTR